MRYPKAIQNLIDKLALLPSVGPKTAERYAFFLFNQDENKLLELAQAISNVQKQTAICQSCLAIAESSPCPICVDTNRSQNIVCVVENIQDLTAIESTKQYQGRYFVLGGLIDTINGIGPENLNIAKLAKLVQSGQIKELILALNFTLEGETTSLYLNKTFKEKVKITRLAKGLPAGSDLEYADQITLSSALTNRGEIN